MTLDSDYWLVLYGIFFMGLSVLATYLASWPSVTMAPLIIQCSSHHYSHGMVALKQFTADMFLQITSLPMPIVAVVSL